MTEVDIGWTRALADAWGQHWGVYLAAWFGHVLEEYRDRMDPNVVGLMERGLAMGAVDFKRLEVVRTESWRSLAAILADHDALLCPTMSQPARPVGESDGMWDGTTPEGRYTGLDITAQFNYMPACPVLSVPAGFSDGGLPIGLQVVARRHQDDLALRIGAALEDARPWAGRRPPL